VVDGPWRTARSTGLRDLARSRRASVHRRWRWRCRGPRAGRRGRLGRGSRAPGCN